MKRPLEILEEERAMKTIVGLTGAFESLSSMKITQTKGRVLIANEFFREVWNIYKQIRVDAFFNFGRHVDEKPLDKELMILITAPSGLTGDIDQRLIKQFKQHYQADQNDIICIGHHGATQLEQSKIKLTYYFDLPKKDFINVDPLMAIIRNYRAARIYYQDYVSLTKQEVKELDLGEVVNSMGKVADLETVSDNMITEKTYIFEPNPYAVVMHLEKSMLRLILQQFVYDSRLAQTASRFRAMTAAKTRSEEAAHDLHVSYSRAKRMLVDTRLKESLAGLKKLRADNNS